MQDSQRYYIEHIQMPEAFFSAPQQFMSQLGLGREEFVEAAYNYLPPEIEPLVMPREFSASDFEVKLAKIGARYCGIIAPPVAEMAYDCPLLGVSTGPKGANPVYRTIERTADGQYLLCGWGADRSHYIFETLPGDLTVMEQAMLEALSTAMVA